MGKRRKKKSAASLANLVPGGNLKHGAFKFLQTGVIPDEHKDIGDEARRMRKELVQAYCRPGNPVLEVLQPLLINRLVSDCTFSEILWRHLWSEAARARGDKLQKCLTSSAWMILSAADNRIVKAFRELNRNLKDFY